MNRTQVDAERFLFSSDVPSAGSRVSVTVHWSAFEFSPSSSSLAPLGAFISPRPEVAEVWFVFPRDCIESMDALRGLDEYKLRTSDLAGVTYRFFEVHRDGNWAEIASARSDGFTAPIEVGAAEIDYVKTDGMRQLFRDTDSLVSASAGFHFERPGRGHSEHFIRTSQAVARAQHAYFIAMAVLPLVVPRNNVRLYADTAGILPLLTAIRDLWRRLGSRVKNVSVDSFGGYDGVDRNLVTAAGRDYVFISSSTSGTLAASIVSRSKSESTRTITVFYLGSSTPRPEDGLVVCDLTNRDERPVISVRDARQLPYSSFRVSIDSSCDLCEAGSHPIELVGDEFFPTATSLKLRMPKFSDRPYNKEFPRLSTTLRHFDGEEYFQDFYGLGVITSTQDDLSDGRGGRTTRRYGVSTRIGPVLQSESQHADHVLRRLRTMLDEMAPETKALAAIVSLSDADSRAVGEFAARQLFGSSPTEVSKNIWQRSGSALADSLEAALDALPRESLVVVCAGVVGSGRALLNLSRTLRRLPESVETAYLIGVAHPESANAQLIFRSSLGVRSGTQDSNFKIGWELPREPGGPGGLNPWDRERRTLGSVEGWLSRYSEYNAARRAVGVRIGLLTNLSDSYLFGSSLVDERATPVMQSVNPKFALWPFEWSEHPRTAVLGVQPTQPEIFSTVAHLMFESRRSFGGQSGASAVVRRQGYALNPAIFDRFNEPQIQSAILRAAEPGELHYQSAVDASRAAADVLKHILDHAVIGVSDRSLSESGGSAYEMLLSICDGLINPRGPGMRISAHDLGSVIQSISPVNLRFANYPPIIRGLLLYVEGRGFEDQAL